MASWYQMSRPPLISMVSPVRRTTTTFSTLGIEGHAASTLALRWTMLPRRHAPSAVMMSVVHAVGHRLGGEPPNAVDRADPQASMATAASGSSKMPTRSPFITSDLRTFELADLRRSCQNTRIRRVRLPR
jgi:hypothetical protein